MRRNNIEEQTAIAFIARLEQYHPDAAKLCWHTPNESKSAQKTNIGIRKGVPDYFLAIPSENHHGLFLEFKAPKGKISDDQTHMMALLEQQCYRCEVVYSWEEGIKAVKDYLTLK